MPISPALAGNVGAGWAFALSRDGIRMSTFLRSLRPVPAAASWIGGMSLYGVV
jgi:hypothetical protein